MHIAHAGFRPNDSPRWRIAEALTNIPTPNPGDCIPNLTSDSMTRLLRIFTVTGMASCLLWAMLGSPLYAQNATPAPSPTPNAPTPTLEQRVAGLEAYVTNGDPTGPLKDKDGNIPKDLTIGGSEYFFLQGVNSVPNTDYGYWVSQNVYAMYQLMFAIITPALIVGAIAERMKYWAIMSFLGVWMFLVYFPMAHMVWGITGFMNGIWNPTSGIKAIDFAGGTVVHMTSGWSALILCLILGPRLGFNKEPMPPHSMVLCMIGTGMLWVGWYGFNAGSAVAADVISSNAFMATTLATAIGWQDICLHH